MDVGVHVTRGRRESDSHWQVLGQMHQLPGTRPGAYTQDLNQHNSPTR